MIRNFFSKPMTVQFPHESIPIPEGYRGRHEYRIDDCISCGLCAKICPNKAIDMIEAPAELKDDYPKTYPRVDLGKCCFCGLCDDICPKDSLKLSKFFFLATFDKDSAYVEPFEQEVKQEG